MWNRLGFRESPYNTKPLKVSRADIELLIGRETDQIDFLTAIESDEQGVQIISGVPGVGKTSFLNVQMYLLESGEADFGPRLLSARHLCPIQPYDEPKNIALRCIQSYCNSIEQYCNLTKTPLPKQTAQVASWIHQNKPATITFGITVIGTGISGGREIHLPSVSETTYETFVEILQTLSQEVVINLNLKGSFIVLDNVENLHDEDLSDCLTTFRDTLFTIPNIWWILIGQSGLSSLIQSTNPKVYQRLSTGIELEPISVENLIEAVDIRVRTFHETTSNGTSPITKEVYIKLFESSNGEIRFVFQYCHAICVNLIQTVRKNLVEDRKKLDETEFNIMMAMYLLNNQVANDFSYACLKNIITKEFVGHHLSQTEKSILKRIGDIGKVSSKEYVEFSEFGVRTMQDFVTNYLVKLRDLQLLFRRQEGKKITHELRGISVFAMEYGLLD